MSPISPSLPGGEGYETFSNIRKPVALRTSLASARARPSSAAACAIPRLTGSRKPAWLASLTGASHVFSCVSSHFGGSAVLLSAARDAQRIAGAGVPGRGRASGEPTGPSARICANFASSTLPPVASATPARGDRADRRRARGDRAGRLRRLRRAPPSNGDRLENARRDPRGRHGRGQQRELRARLGLDRQRRLADHARPRTRRRQGWARADLRGRPLLQPDPGRRHRLHQRQPGLLQPLRRPRRGKAARRANG